MPAALALLALGAWLTAAIAMASDASARFQIMGPEFRKQETSGRTLRQTWISTGAGCKLSPIGLGACPEKVI
jgi:hypothetical protein